MKKKSLIETNPYLKDPLLREEMILRSVISSSTIEGVRPSKKDMTRLKELTNINKGKFLAIRKKYHPHPIPTPRTSQGRLVQ